MVRELREPALFRRQEAEFLVDIIWAPEPAETANPVALRMTLGGAAAKLSVNSAADSASLRLDTKIGSGLRPRSPSASTRASTGEPSTSRVSTASGRKGYRSAASSASSIPRPSRKHAAYASRYPGADWSTGVGTGGNSGAPAAVSGSK